MTTNVYLMPSIGDGSKADPKRGKYVSELLAASVTYMSMDYGSEPVFLVAALDVPSGVHSTMAGHADVTAVPDLAQNIGAQLTAVQNALEALNIPSGWVTSGMSYGSVVRVVAIVFQLAQRLQGQGVPRLFDGTVTLDTRFNQLTQTARNQLIAMAQSFNFDTSSLSGASTIRTILKALADQWPAISIPFGGLTL